MPDQFPNHARFIRRLEMATSLDSCDKAVLRAMPMRLVNVGAKSEVVAEGQTPHESCIILSGVACRQRMLPQGARQILSFHFSGDLPDLQSLYLAEMDHTIVTTTEALLGYVPHAVLREMSDTRPNIARALSAHSLVDAAIFREWIVNIGRRPALMRTAHLLCEIYARMRAMSLARNGTMILPLTQIDLADALGLSTVHVNRVLQALRRDGLIKSEGKQHVIADWAGLQSAGAFNDRYLHLSAGTA